MNIFKKVKNYINNLECESTFTYNDIYDKLLRNLEWSEGNSSLLQLYLAAFSQVGVLEPSEDLSEYTVKRKIVDDLSLYNFLEVINGGNYKEWFVQVCQP